TMLGGLAAGDLSSIRAPWASACHSKSLNTLSYARSVSALDVRVSSQARSVSAQDSKDPRSVSALDVRDPRSVSALDVRDPVHARCVSPLDVKDPRSVPWGHRPKSTPVTRDPRLQTIQQSSRKVGRPQTAMLSGHTGCDRVRQLELESTQQYKLRSHLPLKRSKPPSWQKSSNVPVTQLLLGQGYILSKTKTSSHVTLKDEFFETSAQESSRRKIHTDDTRDKLMEQLQQQITDLALYLEEERLSHKQTKHKAEQILKDKIDQMTSQFQDQIRDLKTEHQEELLQQKQKLQAEHTEVRNTLENQISHMAKEIEFLQSAFETYKGTLQTEASQKSSTSEEKRNFHSAEEKQQAIHEIKSKLIQEWNQERSNLAREHQKAIEAMRQQHKQEMDSLVYRFSNAAADLEKLKETTELLEETKSELQSLKDSYSTVCQQLASVTDQLRDAKVRLVDFEERFEEKVSQIDAKYTQKLQELMTQNTELKRLFVQKCGELFDEKANSDYKRVQRVKSARETLQMLVKSKQRANLSIALGAPAQKIKCYKNRPLSAPGTREDTRAAYDSAGQVELHR
ncbi:unnamed protein product, partial [Candidula unifasciata]